MDIETLTNQAITGKYVPHGEISDGDCVIGFSFGYRLVNGRIQAGLSNEDLADFIVKLKMKIPLILQFEIADALIKLNLTVLRISKHRQEGAYLDTGEVAKQAFGIMKKNKWKKAVLVAHPFHMPRVDAVCKKLGIVTIVPKGLEVIRFDSNSAQEWTVSEEAWSKHEPGVIIRSINLELI